MFLSKFLGVGKQTTKKKPSTMEEGSKLGEGAMGAIPARAARSIEGADASGSQQGGDEEPFVNHRLIAWEQRRKDWVSAGGAAAGAGTGEGAEGGSNGGNGGGSKPPRAHRRPVLSADATYDDLLTSSRPFPKPVPLNEMVDFLVEVWDEDGLYD
jgi:hypothetical protein